MRPPHRLLAALALVTSCGAPIAAFAVDQYGTDAASITNGQRQIDITGPVYWVRFTSVQRFSDPNCTIAFADAGQFGAPLVIESFKGYVANTRRPWTKIRVRCLTVSFEVGRDEMEPYPGPASQTLLPFANTGTLVLNTALWNTAGDELDQRDATTPPDLYGLPLVELNPIDGKEYIVRGDAAGNLGTINNTTRTVVLFDTQVTGAVDTGVLDVSSYESLTVFCQNGSGGGATGTEYVLNTSGFALQGSGTALGCPLAGAWFGWGSQFVYSAATNGALYAAPLPPKIELTVPANGSQTKLYIVGKR
jgi:hypothetical protein